MYLRTHKEISLLIGVAVIMLIAGFNLFHDQPASRFTKAGASVLSTYTPGGAGRCNIPSYEDYYGTPYPPGDESPSVNNDAATP